VAGPSEKDIRYNNSDSSSLDTNPLDNFSDDNNVIVISDSFNKNDSCMHSDISSPNFSNVTRVNSDCSNNNLNFTDHSFNLIIPNNGTENKCNSSIKEEKFIDFQLITTLPSNSVLCKVIDGALAAFLCRPSSYIVCGSRGSTWQRNTSKSSSGTYLRFSCCGTLADGSKCNSSSSIANF